jgi:hypothetical protein
MVGSVVPVDLQNPIRTGVDDDLGKAINRSNLPAEKCN